MHICLFASLLSLFRVSLFLVYWGVWVFICLLVCLFLCLLVCLSVSNVTFQSKRVQNVVRLGDVFGYWSLLCNQY